MLHHHQAREWALFRSCIVPSYSCTMKCSFWPWTTSSARLFVRFLEALSFTDRKFPTYLFKVSYQGPEPMNKSPLLVSKSTSMTELPRCKIFHSKKWVIDKQLLHHYTSHPTLQSNQCFHKPITILCRYFSIAVLHMKCFNNFGNWLVQE